MCQNGRDGEASIMTRSWPTGGCCAMGKKYACTVSYLDGLFIEVQLPQYILPVKTQRTVPLCIHEVVLAGC
jgi:hypothetical protein